MSGFSSILKISDLDDFINPSQDCIKPVEKSKVTEEVASLSKIKIRLEDEAGLRKQLAEPVDKNKYKKVEVSLTDCLACSGCITSAESVLISQQSPDELFRVLEVNKRSEETTAVVSLGVQAVISLANKFGMEAQETAEKIAGLFSELGADYTTVVTVAEDLSLMESYNEFNRSLENGTVPILTGICPGWVCYGEKLHQHALPKISRVKSAQQIMGSLIKLIYGPTVGRSPDELYHITLMSCFDRKLEASRTDFFLEEYKAKEVDVVITALEIEMMCEKLAKNLQDFPRVPLVDLFSGQVIPQQGYLLRGHQGSGSGGYAEFVMRSMADKQFGKKLDAIEWKVGRNPDILEATIEDALGKPIKFGIATGFRNIQTTVRKLKSKTSVPHYLEIMACPTGCLNGGAQVRPLDLEPSLSRELSAKLEANYHLLPVVADMSAAERILKELFNDSKLYSRVLYTDFHAIEKPINLGIKW